MTRKYGEWAGNPNGTLEDPEQCIKEVWPSNFGGGWNSYQCQRKRGHGSNGEYCKQHAKIKERNADS